MRTRIKVCGITRPQDAIMLARSGVDAIGMVFYQSSPRAVTIEQAQLITATLPPFVTVVGLFVDATVDQIQTTVDAVRLDCLQFHGEESPDDCASYSERFGLPYIKSIRMRDGLDVRAYADRYTKASGLLLDSYQHGVPGGTGKSFDWSRIPADIQRPLILAGGLTADNVAAGIRQVRPYAVDVSGGVEVAKGIKDKGKVIAFIQAVNSKAIAE